MLDRNDNTPMFLQEEYTFNVSENTGQLLSEFRVFANDRDEGNNAVVMYTFTEGNEENAFLLGELTLFPINDVPHSTHLGQGGETWGNVGGIVY